jgi:hypothetical protein
MLGPCWHLFGTCGHDFGTTGHHCGTPGQQVVAWGTHVWNLMRFWRFSGPCGAPFFTIGGHYFDSWRLEWWEFCIWWVTWFQVRFWDEIWWVSEVFGMVKTMVSCGRGCQNHSFSGTWIFSILGSILMVFLIWKWYQSWYVADFGGPRGGHGEYWKQP